MYWLSRTKKRVCFHVVLIKTRVLIDDVNIIYTVWQNNTISNISALLIKNLYERISRWEWLVKRVTKTHVSIYNIRIVIINYILLFIKNISILANFNFLKEYKLKLFIKMYLMNFFYN